MPRARKINLEKVRASLDAVCPKCGGLIPPADVRRVDFERIECPVSENSLCPALGGESGPVQAQKRPNRVGVGPIFELICCVMLRLAALVHPTHQVGNAPFK
jgi:hypothetical protein